MSDFTNTSRRAILGCAGLWSTILLGRQRVAAQTTSSKPLPASIAAISSMRNLVKPMTVNEREDRIARARQLMTENKIDAILLTGGTSLAYFSGVHWFNSERLFATVIPARGKGFCICPSFEEGRAKEQLEKGPLEGLPVLTWREDESPYTRIADGLRDRGNATGTVGIEERTPWVFSDEIGKAASALRLVSATPVTAGCRMIKSAQELELMRIANQATLRVYEAVYRALQPGMTQGEASDLISAAYGRTGFRGEASVEIGEWSANPHGSLTPQIIKEDTIVMIDDGCTVEGYNSDITRAFVLGKPSDKMRQVFDIVHRAQSAALAAAKPGVACEGIDAAARKVITDAGYGPDYKFFTHRVGHGIGMDGHEWPYLVRGNRLPLQANMTFSDEPGIYIAGEFGVRLEDDMHITENGAALFTPQSPSLEHPFG